MRISPISVSNRQSLYSGRNNKNNAKTNRTTSFATQQKNNIAFQGRFGRLLGTITGAGVGAAAGGAIIGGGSLAAGAAMLTGPVGIAAVAAAYFIGGAAVGQYLGKGIGHIVEDKINENDDDYDYDL